MKLQKNLLLIPVVVALVWGLFGLFAPETLMKLLKTPSESINPALISTQMLLAISQIGLGIIAFLMRSIKARSRMKIPSSIIYKFLAIFSAQPTSSWHPQLQSLRPIASMRLFINP